MKRIALIFSMLWMMGTANSQTFDLIVTDKGDSLACDIENITDTAVHFKMIYEDHWVHAHIPTDQVVDMKENAVDKRRVEFRPGTSYFRTIKSGNEVKTMFYTRRNTIYLGVDLALTFSINYERLIPIADHFGFSLRAGIGYNPFNTVLKDGTVAILQGTILTGGPCNFFEFGFAYVRYIQDKIDVGAIVVAYRFQSLSGFYIKPCLNLNTVLSSGRYKGDTVIFPGFAIGFSL